MLLAPDCTSLYVITLKPLSAFLSPNSSPFSCLSPTAVRHEHRQALVSLPSAPKFNQMSDAPVPFHCGEPMRRFTAAESGRPYVKCDICGVLRSERDLRIPNCHCGMTARLRTSNTASNPGRKFRGCGKLVSDPTKCNFFAWEPQEES